MSNLQEHLINLQDREVLSKEYDESNYAEINSKRPAGKPDSKEYTFELNLVKEYLAFIEAAMEKEGIRNKGLRIRLGKYPEMSKDPRINPKYLGYQTIFFEAFNLDESISTETEEDTTAKVRGASDIPGMNFGTITPP